LATTKYGKYEHQGQGNGNSRNGSTSKTIRGDFGHVELDTPRDRDGEDAPKVVRKRQTSVGNFRRFSNNPLAGSPLAGHSAKLYWSCRMRASNFTPGCV